jgi:hypothetical protein
MLFSSFQRDFAGSWFYFDGGDESPSRAPPESLQNRVSVLREKLFLNKKKEKAGLLSPSRK